MIDKVPLISVIVPIYNVAPYLRKCLDSLKNQTMREIEIIMIDDGSTDESGSIADEYVTSEGQWPVFRVIHTENRGLSATRNAGIDEAKAEFLMFVDSDDWVESEFCEIPYKTAIESNIDLVIFGHNNSKNEKEEKRRRIDVQFGLVDELTAHKYGEVVVWNKLYRKRIYHLISYPEGRIYEDFATTHKLVHQADRVIILKNCLYHHRFRRNSISNNHTASSLNDYFVSTQERYYDLISYGFPECEFRYMVCVSAMRYLSSNIKSEEGLYQKARDILDKTDLTIKRLNLKQRTALVLWNISEDLFRFLFYGNRD